MPRSLRCLALILVLSFALGLPIASACDDLLAKASELAQRRDSDPEVAVAQGEQQLAAARRRTPRCALGEAMLLTAIANNLHILGRIGESITYYQEALSILPEEASPAQRAAVHRGTGVSLSDAGDYVRALEHYLDALASSQAAGDTLEAAKTAGNIGNLYNSLNEFDLARDYHQQALAGFEDSGFRQGVAGTSLNLGAVALKVATEARAAGDAGSEQRALQEAVDHHERALALFTEMGNERGIALTESAIGKALSGLGRWREAIPRFQRAIDLHLHVGDRRGEVNARINLAEAQSALGEHDLARGNLALAESAIDDLPPSMSLLIATVRVDIAEAEGRFEEALRWQREVQRLSGVLADEQYNTRVLELQARFDTHQQSQEIELLRSQAALRDLELSRQRMVVFVAVVVVLLVVLILAVLYGRLRMGRRIATELKRAARTDSLTGLSNRRHMIACIDDAVRQVRNGGAGFVVIMIDVDDFKSINDRFGHGVGDKALQEVGRRLASRLRQDDLLARWGGEEFLVLLTDTDLAGGQIVAEHLRAVVASAPMHEGDHAISLSISLGVCEYRAGMGVDECVNCADRAMYSAKRLGGNRIGGVADGDRPSGEVMAAR